MLNLNPWPNIYSITASICAQCYIPGDSNIYLRWPWECCRQSDLKRKQLVLDFTHKRTNWKVTEQLIVRDAVKNTALHSNVNVTAPHIHSFMQYIHLQQLIHGSVQYNTTQQKAEKDLWCIRHQMDSLKIFSKTVMPKISLVFQCLLSHMDFYLMPPVVLIKTQVVILNIL